MRNALEFLADRTAATSGMRGAHALASRASDSHARYVPRADIQELNDYVDQCAEQLWKPAGARVRNWLMDVRCLSEEVLRRNRIGADLGPRKQHRPNGMPRMSGAVLPVINDGRAVYAQLRVLDASPNNPRYLNPRAELAPNPRIARIRPAGSKHEEVIVTEGTMDALSAALGGYRSVAVLGATYADNYVAQALSTIRDPLVIVFDPDEAGTAGGRGLANLLQLNGNSPSVVHLHGGDLNELLVGSNDWSRTMDELVVASRTEYSLGIAL